MSEQTETRLVATYNEDNYAKSNFLIMSKYRASLLDNKIHAINLARADSMKKDPETGALVQDLPVTYYKEMLGVTGGSIYQELKNAAKSMTSKSIGMSSPDEKRFEYIAFVVKAECKDGRFRTYYNPYLSKYMEDLKSNFTILNLPITLAFKKSVYSQRLYELLRSSCYFKAHEKPDMKKQFREEYPLAELKFLIGTINADNEKVVKVLNKSKTPDYERAAEVTTDKVLDDWRSFRRRALEPAIEEINDISDINVSYETRKVGRGGKISEIIFTMTFKEAFYAKKYGITPTTVDASERAEIEEWLSDTIETPLKVRDIRSICEAAGYDKELIKKANDALWDYQGKVENVPGFMIDVIRKGGYEKIARPAKEKKKTKKNTFNNFEQREIDYDDLERKFEEHLIKSQMKQEA